MSIDKVARIFKLLGDENRLRILLSLVEEAKNVTQIVESTLISQSNVSHQLNSLRLLDVVKVDKSNGFSYYRLADDHIKTILLSTIEHVGEENEKDN
ncbi:MAG: metalloregulator ArsR/SmtB family transcription factor [Acholeplasmatales bacterium]|jgi:ArsR family transcriptional regulator|nr:metalloregulator ArsR/SmtB family transcription factor [Acholeplasmatales bacterium]